VRSTFFHLGVATACVCVCGGGLWLALEDRFTGNRALSNPLMPMEDLDSLIERRLAVAKRRIEVRQRIAHEVMAGHLTLLQAAEQYRDLNETKVDFSPEVIRFRYSTSNDDECACRQVIEFVRQELRETPDKGKAIVEGLEKELATLVRDGEVKLPP
jgi:hypothetical protein